MCSIDNATVTPINGKRPTINFGAKEWIAILAIIITCVTLLITIGIGWGTIKSENNQQNEDILSLEGNEESTRKSLVKLNEAVLRLELKLDLMIKEGG